MLMRMRYVWILSGVVFGCVSMSACAPEERATSVAYTPTGTLNNFMAWHLDPAVDVLWDSAGFILTQEGEEDLQPTTDEGWDRVRNAATVVAESGNLLRMPGYAVDDGDWMEYAKGLVIAGQAARDAALARDADALFQAGARLYNVCLACHSKYIVEQQAPSE